MLTGFLDEALLRKRIQELQSYRRLGLSTAADIEKYELDLSKRVRPLDLISLSSTLRTCIRRNRPRSRLYGSILLRIALLVVNHQDLIPVDPVSSHSQTLMIGNLANRLPGWDLFQVPVLEALHEDLVSILYLPDFFMGLCFI